MIDMVTWEACSKLWNAFGRYMYPITDIRSLSCQRTSSDSSNAGMSVEFEPFILNSNSGRMIVSATSDRGLLRS
jgi:hypothetical protein